MRVAWLEGADADFYNLIDEGLRDAHAFAWKLARGVADERVLLLVSVQRALAGAVSGSLHGVCIALEEKMGPDRVAKTIVLTFYAAENATEADVEALRRVGTDVIADFTDNFLLDERFVRVADAAEPLPTVGEWVYLQRGISTIES